MNGYGFFKKLLFGFLHGTKFFKPLLAIAAAITLQFHLLPALLPGLAGANIGGFAIGQAVIAGISSGVGNVIATGKPKAFLAGFGQGFATFGIGHGLFGGAGANAKGLLGVTAKESSQFGSAAYVGKAVAHGVVGGAFSAIRGGSFSSGFLSAGLSSAVAPFGPDPLTQLWKGAAFSAAAGGVGSVLGGGKFADGAVTGAFTYLYNEAASGRIENRESLRNQRDALAEEINAEIQALSAEEQKWEWGAVIYFETSDTLTRSELVTSKLTRSNPALVSLMTEIGADRIISTVHNHPSGDPNLSGGDIANRNWIRRYNGRDSDFDFDLVNCFIVTIDGPSPGLNEC